MYKIKQYPAGKYVVEDDFGTGLHPLHYHKVTGIFVDFILDKSEKENFQNNPDEYQIYFDDFLELEYKLIRFLKWKNSGIYNHIRTLIQEVTYTSNLPDRDICNIIYLGLDLEILQESVKLTCCQRFPFDTDFNSEDPKDAPLLFIISSILEGLYGRCLSFSPLHLTEKYKKESHTKGKNKFISKKRSLMIKEEREKYDLLHSKQLPSYLKRKIRDIIDQFFKMSADELIEIQNKIISDAEKIFMKNLKST